jgi:hypothetical protein
MHTGKQDMRQALTETRLEEFLSIEEDLMDDRFDWFTANEVGDLLRLRGSPPNSSPGGPGSTSGSSDFLLA